MKALKRLLILACLPVVVHLYVTSPVLWAHGSSAAFNLNVVVWIAVVLAFGYILTFDK